MKTLNELQNALHALLTGGNLRKLTLSRPRNPEILRSEGRLFEKNGEHYLQIETFRGDGKATHRNFPASEGASAVFSLLLDENEGYGQLNLLSPLGDAEARRSKSGNWLIGGKIKKSVKYCCKNAV